MVTQHHAYSTGSKRFTTIIIIIITISLSPCPHSTLVTGCPVMTHWVLKYTLMALYQHFQQVTTYHTLTLIMLAITITLYRNRKA